MSFDDEMIHTKRRTNENKNNTASVIMDCNNSQITEGESEGREGLERKGGGRETVTRWRRRGRKRRRSVGGNVECGGVYIIHFFIPILIIVTIPYFHYHSTLLTLLIH